MGLDVALGRQIAEDMGLEFEVIHMDFDNLFQLLNQGRCDMVIAAMEYNEERGENGGYSDGYYSDIPPKIIVKAGTEDQYTSLEDFDGKVRGRSDGHHEGRHCHQRYARRHSQLHVLRHRPDEQPGL